MLKTFKCTVDHFVEEIMTGMAHFTGRIYCERFKPTIESEHLRKRRTVTLTYRSLAQVVMATVRKYILNDDGRQISAIGVKVNDVSVRREICSAMKNFSACRLEKRFVRFLDDTNCSAAMACDPWRLWYIELSCKLSTLFVASDKALLLHRRHSTFVLTVRWSLVNLGIDIIGRYR